MLPIINVFIAISKTNDLLQNYGRARIVHESLGLWITIAGLAIMLFFDPDTDEKLEDKTKIKNSNQKTNYTDLLKKVNSEKKNNP